MGISRTGLRTARAAVFTALCVALSAGAHVLLSGTPLPVPTVAAVTLAVFALAFLLAGRERGFGRIAALLVPLQVAADTVFTTGQATCYGAAAPEGGSPLRMAGIDLLCAGGDFGTPLARLAQGAPPAAHPAGPWLLLGLHVAVGLAAALWLRGGEAALARMLRAAMAGTFRPLALVVAARSAVPDSRRCAVPAAPRPGPFRALPLLTHSVVRRGPPCPVLAA
ncbi:hypothetical protein GCM10009716_30770 [Streptomyces sodiiphilus]|uniref:Integral membrane protein n=1 Tax=Streptomyces sodiiphilus TaxID=226217 RepID=A0ABN2PFS2_9ACTN